MSLDERVRSGVQQAYVDPVDVDGSLSSVLARSRRRRALRRAGAGIATAGIVGLFAVLFVGGLNHSPEHRVIIDNPPTTAPARGERLPAADPPRSENMQAHSSGKPPRQGEPLVDGEYIGFIKGATDSTVEFDVAQFFYGRDAYRYWNDHNTPDSERNNDDVIVNVTTATRHLRVTPGTWATVVHGDLAQHDSLPMAEFAARYARKTDPSISETPLYWIKVRDGYIVAIDGQYQP